MYVCLCVCLCLRVHATHALTTETDRESDVNIFWPDLILKHVVIHLGTHVNSTSCTALSRQSCKLMMLNLHLWILSMEVAYPWHEQGGH